jgi:hypothetical protein
MDQREIFEELLSFYDDNGPNNFYPSDLLECYPRGDESYGVALNRLIAEGYLLACEIDPVSKRVAIALNPDRISDVRRELASDSHNISNEGILGKCAILILIMGFGLLGLWALPTPTTQTLWFLFCLVCYPVVLAYTHGSANLNGAELLSLYRTGVEQIPFIGYLLLKLVPDRPKLTGNDMPKGALKKRSQRTAGTRNG